MNNWSIASCFTIKVGNVDRCSIKEISVDSYNHLTTLGIIPQMFLVSGRYGPTRTGVFWWLFRKYSSRMVVRTGWWWENQVCILTPCLMFIWCNHWRFYFLIYDRIKQDTTFTRVWVVQCAALENVWVTWWLFARTFTKYFYMLINFHTLVCA